MSEKKPIQRLTAMILSIFMVAGMTPISVAAQTGGLPIDVSGDITAFEALGAGIAQRCVPFGTSEMDLKLPDTLIATVRLASLEEEPVLDSGEADLKPDSTDMVGGSAIDIGEMDDIETGAATETTSPSDAGEGGDNSEAEPAEKAADSAGVITVPLPVTWVCAPEYDGKAAGTYIFSSKLPEGITLADGVEAPVITVTVGAAITGAVTAFDALPDDLRWQNTTAPEFPETVGGTVAGEEAEIPVTWEADHDYNADYPVRGLYVFTAVLGKGYTLAGGAELPRITVYIPQTVGGRMSRMAGGGTTDSPLEITTAAQLAEIATLVNARANGLELFLFNSKDASVSLKLMDDIDLSAYSKGEGWMPIGIGLNSFKGIFDGGGHQITGLEINRSANFQGLFGYVGSGGTVKNLGVVEASITGKDYVGGVAGYVYWGTVQNCFVTGSVTGSLAGGAAGGVSWATVQNCYSTCNVTGSTHIGGVVGWVDRGTMQNCYSTGSVTGSFYAGGVAGDVLLSGTVQNCAALNPSVSGASPVGRVAGNIYKGNLSSNIAFAGMTVTEGGSGKPLVEGADQVDGESKTAAEIKAAGFFEALFGNDTAWTYAEGKLPVLAGLSGQSGELPAYITGFAGAGTSAEDPYRIHTAEDLKYMADMVNSVGSFAYGKFFRLENDIDLSAYGKSYDGGKGWTPIGRNGFINAVFDGNGKTITGLYINQSNQSFTGLFGQVMHGTIRNLFLEGIALNSYTDYSEGIIGGLAGQVSAGSTISGCAATGSVSGEGAYVANCAGGLVGILDGGSTLNNCAFYGTVSAEGKSITDPPIIPPNTFAGGIAGRVCTSAAVTDCLSVADVYATIENAYAGGIAGQVDDGAKIARSAALGAQISADTTAGRIGIIGSGASGDPENKNYAWSGIRVNDSTVSGAANNLNGANTSTAAIKTLWTSGALNGWDSDVWTLAEGRLPVLTGLSGLNSALPAYIAGLSGAGTSADDPYRIHTAEDLKWMADQVNSNDGFSSGKYFRLENDIDLSAYGTDYDGGKGWTPIGMRMVYTFMGNFNGNNKTVTGLTINRPEADCIGLFGYLHPGSKVQNLRIMGASVTGKKHVGGVAGYAWGMTVESCAASGSISGAERIGGVVGFASSSTVGNCYSTGNVTGIDYIGGVVGYFENTAAVQSCYSTASITGKEYIGGVVGFLASGTVKNCYSAGNATGIGRIGGVAGYVHSGTVQNCYSTGSITGADSYIGGAVGSLGSGTVKNCVALNRSINAGIYNFGRVVGNSHSGDLLNNYAFSRIPGTWVNKGSKAKDGADVTSQTLFSGNFWTMAANWDTSAWDSTVWTFADDKLPVLKTVGGMQSGEDGLYLTQRDIRYATVGAIGDLTYNGSRQIPVLAVTFDGEALVKDKDYTASITSMDGSGVSAGTNAGEVTLTITGIGSFKGIKTATYTIGKAPLTISGAVINPKTYDGTTIAEVAYVNFDGLQLIETLTPGTDYTVTGVRFNSADAGGNKTVTALVALANTQKADNYTLVNGTLNETGQSIEKRQITLTTDNKTIIKGGGLPQLTYTVGNLPAGKTKSDALNAEPIISCPTFDSNMPGNYAIILAGGTATDNYTITTRTNGTLTVAEQTYTVTFNLNGGSRTGGGELTQIIVEGGAATAPTVFRSGYIFTGWNKAFSNVTSNLTVTANWSCNGEASDFWGGYGIGDYSATPAALEKKLDPPATAEAKMRATVDGSGKAAVNAADKAIVDAIKTAQDAAKKNETGKNGIAVSVNVITDKAASSLAATLSQNAVNELVKAGVKELRITSSSIITVTFDLTALKQFRHTGGSMTLTANKGDVSKLSAAARTAIGSRPVFDLSVRCGGKTVSSFGGGLASVAIPYTLGVNEKAGNLFCVYADENGRANWLSTSSYDKNAKLLRFSTKHFSVYGIGYKAGAPAFTDIANHWAKEDIEFVTARGLFSNLGKNQFSPDAGITRGMFVTALGRLAEIDTATFKNSNFTDVSATACYAPYVAWAAEKNILSGTGAAIFAPDQNISRQEMAVIMQNYAKFMGCTVPKAREAISFADSGNIASWAKDAVQSMQMSGILMGKDQNRFDPTAPATRAEVAAALHRYVELVIGKAMAQGWEKNDSGKWMYYVDGKAVTGMKAIDGTSYHFDDKGILTKVDAVAPDTKKYVTYKVKKGNTLWGIAKIHNCTVGEIVTLNGELLSDPDLIYAGWSLKIPQK